MELVTAGREEMGERRVKGGESEREEERQSENTQAIYQPPPTLMRAIAEHTEHQT
jgi:hypothetical protein